MTSFRLTRLVLALTPACSVSVHCSLCISGCPQEFRSLAGFCRIYEAAWGHATRTGAFQLAGAVESDFATLELKAAGEVTLGPRPPSRASASRDSSAISARLQRPQGWHWLALVRTRPALGHAVLGMGQLALHVARFPRAARWPGGASRKARARLRCGACFKDRFWVPRSMLMSSWN